jgi:DNA helicase IV
MRLPPESQLSTEQKEVCFAPTRESILVTGPPGSGKTVVAIFRHTSLEKQEEEVQTLVFTNVLKQYTNIDATFLSWLGSWWKRCASRSFPMTRNGRQILWDYDSAQLAVREDFKDGFASKGHWGHMILDEAQDFPSSAHGLLYLVQNLVFGHLEVGARPQVTVLADENQRLNDNNSTIEEIKTAYLMAGKQLYTLEKNYRNTREIAELAAHFYTGLQTGIPKYPSRKGDTPKLLVTSDVNEAVDKIASYVRLHENEEVGVLVKYTPARKKIFNKLHHRLSGKGITVQTFGWNDPNHGDASKLVFDKPGHVTVLCFASAKGLEFDAVFLPELQTFTVEARGSVEAKMTLYVMISRARERLFLMITDPERRKSIWGILPQRSKLLEIE